MYDRRDLHEDLVNILGSRNVYFQPPGKTILSYPCIVYERHDIDNVHANDGVYLENVKYRVTVIDANPDSAIVARMNKFRYAKFVRHYAVEQLNHDIFDIYF